LLRGRALGHQLRGLRCVIMSPHSVSAALSTSASLRKRPKCCVAAKRRYVPGAEICSAANLEPTRRVLLPRLGSHVGPQGCALNFAVSFGRFRGHVGKVEIVLRLSLMI